MLVAKDKIKTNIGEYFLYMFQIEDLIRACNFNKQIIESNLVSQYQADDQTKEEIKNWYFGLCELMEEEKLQTKGHLSFLLHKIDEVYDFHLYMLKKPESQDYKDDYTKLIPIINELKEKQQEGGNEINTLISAIYGVYLLKLKKQEISSDTLISASQISKFLAKLSGKFREYEAGTLKIE